MPDAVINITETCLLVVPQAEQRRHELYPGLITELGNLHSDVSRSLKLPPKDPLTDKGKGTIPLFAGKAEYQRTV